MWYGRSITSSGTPVPDREIEAKSSGNGPVITYRLSPEELERVRRGERLETRKEEQNVATRTEAPKAPDKMEVLRRLAAGKPVSKIETEMGLGKGVLHYWIGRWGLRGVKGEQAQRLLDEMQIDMVSGHVPVEPKPLKSSELAQEQVKDELIERLKKELAEKTARIAELEQFADELRIDRDKWIDACKEAREERDALLQTVERAVDGSGRREVSSIEAIEAATAELTGAHAYHTGAAIQHLWRWKTVEDLRRARGHIDRLMESIVVGNAG